MLIPNNYTQNYPIIWLQLLVETFGHSTNQNSIKGPKVVELMNKKTLYKNFGD